MDTLTSRLIARVEQLHELPEELAKLGYHSVFDVVHVPRERFIRLHRNTLGRRAEKMYDLAIGYAHQVVHHFRYNRVTRAVKSTLRGPFSVAGPDFKNQFQDTDWQEKAPNGALEANDGPAAYLTHLYALALKQEKTDDSQLMNTLADRRPDLGELKVDDAALNEVIPQLQLVNEILAAAIKKSPDAIKKSQLAKIQNIEQSNGLDTVNELLAITRYPNNLPYHYGHQQIQAAQSVLGLTLQEVLLPHTGSFPRRFWNVTDALLEKDVEALNRLQIMASQLAPEQQKIIIEKTSDWSKFYQENYGEASLHANSFADMDVFTARTGLTVPQVEQLLCTTAGGATVVLSENFKEKDKVVGQYTYGACFIHAGEIPSIAMSKKDSGALTLDDSALTDDRLDRINRIVRLQKWLELPYEDVDLLVTSAMRAEGEANNALSMNVNTLRMLGVFKHYQTAYGVSAKQFAAWLYEVTPYAISPNTPFFDQVFNASGAFDTPFVVDDQDFDYTSTTGEDGARVQHISTALGLSRRQFLLLADRIACQYGDVIESKLTCSLSMVSAFYRLTTLARTLGFSVEAFCVLLDRLDNGTGGAAAWKHKGALWQQLARQPSVKQLAQFDAITSDVLSLLQALSTVAQWQHQHQLPMQALQLLTLPPAGYYGVVSTGDQMQRVSVGWKDLLYDSGTGELTLTQQIKFRGGERAKTDGISVFQYTLPNGLSRNGDLNWQGEALKDAVLQNDKYDGKGANSDRPIDWPGTWLYPDKNKTYVLNIPLKGKFKDISKLNVLSSTLIIHSYNFNTTLTFSEGAILTENMGLAAQGTTDQLNFIQQVCNSLTNTFVDAALLNRSGAPVVDDKNQAIDWLNLLSPGLLDLDVVKDHSGHSKPRYGLVKDVEITEETVGAVLNAKFYDNGNAQPVGGKQPLSKQAQIQASKALTNTLIQAQQAQYGVAIGLLAQSLNVNQSLPALLLRWTGQSVYSWLKDTWVLNNNNDAKLETAADIPTDYLRQLREVVRCALLTTQFALSPALVQTLLDHPEYFGFTKENVSRIDLQALYLLSRYHDLLTQVGAVHGGTEDDVLAYLRAANATPPLNNTEAAKLLAPLLGWEQNEALHACDMFDGKVAKTIAQLDTVLRLQQAQKQTGLSVQQQRQGFLLNRDSAYEDWQSAGRALVTGVSHLKGNL
ncbi:MULTISPECIES: Tc toxin subunit A [Burkholderiaceae]|uniref:Tc toxin subunit A n=1 Tax=Burkholderiaceae TaxID=119060 RepID=UPI00095F3537|nr:MULTISPECIES: Tc toxin subunit A [Burkholderiaceae]MCG1017846.1 hypothetical protein [Mycetohabitans sp. B4]SIT67727.1 virulence plasmid A protein [Burkholderia sp. b13]